MKYFGCKKHQIDQARKLNKGNELKIPSKEKINCRCVFFSGKNRAFFGILIHKRSSTAINKIKFD